MWKSMNFKSFLIGGLLAVLVMCAMGSWPVERTVVSSQMHGRFAIVAQDYDAIILDTATGEAWSRHSLKHDRFYDPKIILFEPNDFDL